MSAETCVGCKTVAPHLRRKEKPGLMETEGTEGNDYSHLSRVISKNVLFIAQRNMCSL